MKTRCDVSIVIINYNKPQVTKDCILSVIEHTKGCENFEVILVDNASTEGDISILEGMDDKVKLIKSDKNLGFAKGNNLGIQHSLGDVVLLLNNDTILNNDAISICYNVLMADETIGVVGCKLLNLDDTVQMSGEHFPTISRLLKQTLRLHKFFDPVKLNMVYPLQEATNSIQVDWLWGTFFMFRKSTLSCFKENKLPDIFFMYSEDLQWGYEFNKLGLKFEYVPQAKIYHLKGDNSFSASMIQQNMQLCLSKYKGSIYSSFYFLINVVNIAITRFCKIVFVRK